MHIKLEEKQFLELIREHQGIIYKVVSAYASDPEEKKDLYQEILLQSWKGIRHFRGESRFSTWLYRVCLNTVFSSKRKKSTLVFPGSMQEEPAVPAQAHAQEDLNQLHQAIRQLSEVDRAIILLHLEGYGIGEMAAVLGISDNHLSVKLYRIRQKLANLLKPNSHG